MDYPHRVDVLKLVAGAAGPFRNPVETWEVTRRGVPCNVQRERGREVRTDVGEQELTDYIILADPNPPWRGESRLSWQGRTLVVQDVDPDTAGRGHHSETMARKETTVP